MKLLIASDIHGSYTSLEKLCGIFETIKPELMILCGDYLNHGPRNNIPEGYDTKKTAALLNQYKKNIISVRGNCDSEVDQMILEIPVTSDSAQLYIPSDVSVEKYTINDKPCGRVFITHGHLFSNDVLKSRLPEGSLIISGHTHVPVLQFEDGYFFLNPGSISIPKTDDGATYAVVDFNQHGINRISIYTMDGKELKSFEWWDLFDKDENRMPYTKLRGSESNMTDYRLVSEIITLDKDKNVLLTKRDSAKNPFPNYWEFTGGACISGETAFEGAVREVEEETGIPASNNVKHLKKVFGKNAIYNLFVNYVDKSKSELKVTLQPGETVDYKWVTLAEFEQLFNADTFCPAIQQRYTAKEICSVV